MTTESKQPTQSNQTQDNFLPEKVEAIAEIFRKQAMTFGEQFLKMFHDPVVVITPNDWKCELYDRLTRYPAESIRDGYRLLTRDCGKFCPNLNEIVSAVTDAWHQKHIFLPEWIDEELWHKFTNLQDPRSDASIKKVYLLQLDKLSDDVRATEEQAYILEKRELASKIMQSYIDNRKSILKSIR